MTPAAARRQLTRIPGQIWLARLSNHLTGSGIELIKLNMRRAEACITSGDLAFRGAAGQHLEDQQRNHPRCRRDDPPPKVVLQTVGDRSDERRDIAQHDSNTDDRE
jgi:hypothetical protein